MRLQVNFKSIFLLKKKLSRTLENVDYLLQHPEIQAEHAGKCQNPSNLRTRLIKDLKAGDLHCFHATPVETQRGTLLNCGTDQSFKRIHWLYGEC